jgi:hypothetical protein
LWGLALPPRYLCSSRCDFPERGRFQFSIKF